MADGFTLLKIVVAGALLCCRIQCIFWLYTRFIVPDILPPFLFVYLWINSQHFAPEQV